MSQHFNICNSSLFGRLRTINCVRVGYSLTLVGEWTSDLALYELEQSSYLEIAFGVVLLSTFPNHIQILQSDKLDYERI